MNEKMRVGIRKMGKVLGVNLKIYFGIMIVAIILFSNTAMAQTVSCEKGDLLFRKMAVWGLENFGHTGIYEKWNGNGDPADKSNHYVLESQLGYGPLQTTLDVFCSASDWLGTGSLNPTAAQRNAIISYPPSKIKIGIGFTPGGLGNPEFRGYGDPERYRCDGLAERAYEEANINVPDGIVPNSIDVDVLINPKATYPTKQASYMASYPGVGPNVQITSPSSSDATWPFYKGTITLTAHADDGDRGSGTLLVQFWDGTPPTGWAATPNIGKDKHKADIEDDYTHSWDTTTVGDGAHTIYTKAYDQAGNSKQSNGITITVDNTPPTAAFTHSVSECTVNFDASGSTDATSGIDKYEWDFGDDSTGSGVSPSHIYPNEDTYTVTLTVWDKAGNNDTDTAQVECTCGANAHCSGGACECDEGYKNCDDDWSNGCECSGECCGAGTPNNGTCYTPGTSEGGCCSYAGGCYDGTSDPAVCTACYGGGWHPGWWCEEGECVSEASTFVLLGFGLLCVGGYFRLKRKEN